MNAIPCYYPARVFDSIKTWLLPIMILTVSVTVTCSDGVNSDELQTISIQVVPIGNMSVWWVKWWRLGPVTLPSCCRTVEWR